MRRPLLGLSVVLTLVLAACGSTPTTPTSKPTPTPKQTLYQGDWSWSVVNVSNTSDYASGIASFNLEKANINTASAQKGKLYAAGAFDVKDLTTKPYGLALMGPIVNPLDVAFTYADGTKPALLAVDADGKMETVNGKKTFEGNGNFYLEDGTSAQVTVVLVQQNATPAYKLTGAPSAQQNVDQTQLSSIRSKMTAAPQNSASLARQLALSGAPRLGQGAISSFLARGAGER